MAKKLTKDEIQDLRRTLLRSAPHRKVEIDLLVQAALGTTHVDYVEVTYRDGQKAVMTADEYRRLTALDLQHTNLRWLSPGEAEDRA